MRRCSPSRSCGRSSGETTSCLQVDKTWWYAAIPVCGMLMAGYGVAAVGRYDVARAEREGRTEQDLRGAQVDHSVQRRWADAREVAFRILWLASDEASFCTASAL